MNILKTNIQEIINNYGSCSQEELIARRIRLTVAGRIINRIRSFGELIFADLVDQTGIIQLKTEQNKDFVKVSAGDIIEATGIVSKTNQQNEKKDKQELTIIVENFSILAECQHTLPDTVYYRMSNIEERFRKRYLDFIVYPENRQILVKRHETIRTIQKFLDEQGFIEIETPILVSSASGALAKPFITHHNKLHRDFYLRIATEIPLKTLLVGGFEKIYEIGRIFRNEGIDARHNPEFTTIEIYQAYNDWQGMMELTEKIINTVSKNCFGKTFTFDAMTMLEAIKVYENIDFTGITDREKALELIKDYQLDLQPHQNTVGHIIIAVFEKYVEEQLINPTFIYDYPVEASPLAKSKENDPLWVERFELFINGLEFANGYSELNDPIEQKKRFEEQTRQKKLGNEDVAEFDKEFIEALEYGMPPAGGLGIGIDRLLMLFTEKENIKEVIAFPQLKEKK